MIGFLMVMGWLFVLLMAIYRLFTRPWQVARERASHAVHPRRVFWLTWCGRTFGWGLLVAVMFFPIVGLLWTFLSPGLERTVIESHAVPLIGELRSAIEQYCAENGRLPGLRKTGNEIYGSTSQLSEGLSRVQTFSGTDAVAFVADFREIVVVTNENHFGRECGYTRKVFEGRRIRPEHLFYRVDGCEESGKKRVYVVGIFGDGIGWLLKGGTGYAEMVIRDADLGLQTVMTWKSLWCPHRDRSKQIVMVNAEEAKKYFKCETPEQANTMNLCWVGDTEALMSGDKTKIERALEELKQAGWNDSYR